MITKVNSDGNLVQYPLGQTPVVLTKAPRWNLVARSAAFSTVASDRNLVDTTSAAITCTLPLTPTAGDVIEFLDSKGQFGTNNLTLSRNGSNINGLASDFLCDVAGKKYTATYIDSTYGWTIAF